MLLCILILLSATGINGDVYASIAEIEHMFAAEAEAVVNLKQFITSTEQQLDSIKSYLTDHQKFTDSGLSISKFLRNPINAYRSLKRLSIDFLEVKSSLSKIKENRETLSKFLNESDHLPDREDLAGAALSLVLLQDVYMMNMTKLVKGVLEIPGRKTVISKHRLTARDCLMMGRAAFNRGYYGQAVDWFEVGLQEAETEVNQTASPHEFIPYLRITIRKHDEVLLRKGSFGLTWKTKEKPINQTSKVKYKKFSQSTKLLDSSISEEQELYQFHQLCRGERLRPVHMDKNLYCSYLRRGHPLLLIAPFKIEIVSTASWVMLYHNFLSEREISIMKEQAKNNLERSLHMSYGGTAKASLKRTSKQIWLSDSRLLEIEALSRRIGIATGLKTVPAPRAAEHFQVANYGLGGHYSAHVDYKADKAGNPTPLYFGNPKDPIAYLRGNRLATFLLYLNDVESGGATVFPKLGLTVWPETGMGLFWYNLLEDGNGDVLTVHGGCPVLHGSKWISNKWIGYQEQLFTRGCGLKAQKRIKGPA